MIGLGPQGRKFYRNRSLSGLGSGPVGTGTSLTLTCTDWPRRKTACETAGGVWTPARAGAAAGRCSKSIAPGPYLATADCYSLNPSIKTTDGNRADSCSEFLGEKQILKDGECAWEWFVPKLVVFGAAGLAAFSFLKKRR